jgi:ketosteroid isomerase-like protein
MKTHIAKILLPVLVITLPFACNAQKGSKSLSDLKQELVKVEEDFEACAKNKGITEAFYSYADDSAVIVRRNDTVVKGKENIKKFYSEITFIVALNWKVDFVDVSADGTLGYTFGKFVRTIKDTKGEISKVNGIFHTVWKRQNDGTWKYVWD